VAFETFGNVGRNRNSCSAHLAGQSERLVSGKAGR
jgi:hypothetical protein